MVSWNFADTLAVVEIAFYAFSLFLAYNLTRLTGGAPKAWYLVVAAFGVLLVREVFRLYFDIQSPENMLDDLQVGISLLVSILFSIGLYLLFKTFQRHLTIADSGPSQS